MDKKEIIKEVLEILRDTDMDTVMDVCINTDVDFVLERMGEVDG